jgi:hypothetical protein
LPKESTMRQYLALCAASLLAATAFAAPAAAQTYPVRVGELSVGSSSAGEVTQVRPGQPVEISGNGFAPGAEVVVTFESTPVQVGSTNASAAGAIDLSVRVPTDAEAGDHTLRARGAAPGGGSMVLSHPVRVAGDSSSDLAATGMSAGPLLAGAAGAIGAGAVLITVLRRRHSQ